MSNLCELCIGKGIIWSEGKFYGLICRVHKQPMIVLKEHRSYLTGNEKLEAEAIRQKRYPNLKFRGYIGSIPEHWHAHLIKR